MITTTEEKNNKIGSSQKSVRRCFRENGVKNDTFRRMLQAHKLRPFFPRFLNALNEDDPDRRVGFWEWCRDKCGKKNYGFEGLIVW